MPHIELSVEELEKEKPLRFEHEGRGIVVVRTDSGVYAYEDVCPHAGWRLSDGEIVDGVLECPGHGWQFDIGTGRCADVPAYCLRSITTTRVGDKVRLEWLTQEVVADVKTPL